MAGHNKWSKIKRKKAVNDAKKGAAFGQIIKQIQIAARDGVDPDMNPALRLALDKAKEANMPKDNIERALEKAANKDGQIVMYEGFGPDGVGFLVKTYTDNINRTVAEVRHVFSKHGGSLGTDGSVMWMFETVTPTVEYSVKIPTDADESTLQKVETLYEALEELDDVEEIWTSLAE
jgi:YebC/PmpR family DNA-binding regulatory protein